MSANDFLKIYRDGKEYVISHLDADTLEGNEVKRVKGLKAAIEYAGEYQQEYGVEYGIQFGDI